MSQAPIVDVPAFAIEEGMEAKGPSGRYQKIIKVGPSPTHETLEGLAERILGYTREERYADVAATHWKLEEIASVLASHAKREIPEVMWRLRADRYVWDIPRTQLVQVRIQFGPTLSPAGQSNQPRQ